MLMPVNNENGKPESVCVVMFDVTDTAIATNLLKMRWSGSPISATRWADRYLQSTLLREAAGGRIRPYAALRRNLLDDFVRFGFFKKVNDTYGHLAGDKVLVEVAQRMSDQLRSSDVVAATRRRVRVDIA